MKRIILMTATLMCSIFATFYAIQTFTNWLTVSSQTNTPDPKALILQSVEACLKVKTIEYVFEQESIQGNGQGYELPVIKATVRQERADVIRAGIPGKYQASGTISLGKSAPANMAERIGMKPNQRTANFEFAYDGAMFQILSPTNQTMLMVKPPQPQTIIKLRENVGLITVGTNHFTDSAPFKRMLETNTDFKYLGTTEIGGVKCHIIGSSRVAVNPFDSNQNSTISNRYYIGVDDLLPRRTVIGNIQSTMQIKKINELFDKDAFSVALPNGYSLKMVTDEDLPGLRSVGLLSPGTPAPPWKLLDAESKEHSLADYRGKVVVMDFWATWCGPCIAAMPVMQGLHDKFKEDGVVVIGISNKEEESADPVGFMKKKGYSYQQLLKGDSIVSAYKAETLPTFYIIGKEGQIIYGKRGYNKLEKEELEKIIEQYLKIGASQRIFERRN